MLDTMNRGRKLHDMRWKLRGNCASRSRAAAPFASARLWDWLCLKLWYRHLDFENHV